MFGIGKKINGFVSLVALLTMLSLSGLQSLYAQEVGDPANGNAANGEALFNQHCAACHHPLKKVVGPKLQGAYQKWVDNASAAEYYQWVQNNVKLRETSEYAVQVYEENGGQVMNIFDFLSIQDIDDITAYVDGYTDDGGGGGGGNEADMAAAEEDEGGNMWLILLIAVIVLIPIVLQNFNTIFALSRLKREKQNAEREENGKAPLPEETFATASKKWAWKNQGPLSVIGLIVMFALLSQGYYWLKDVGVYEGYHPSQPVNFPHYVHAGQDQIHCEYCHNSASKSKHAGLPTVNVCMNCHKAIHEGQLYGTEEISKVHAAAGFDKEAGEYTGDTKPIVWNRVYVLPDHVYFNHAQHVAVAGLECQNCHGPVETMETAYLAPVEELVPVEGHQPLTRPTLTMGWCIECHGQTKVQVLGNNASGYYQEIHERLKKRPEILEKYLEDKQIVVKELGGWECAKCHY